MIHHLLFLHFLVFQLGPQAGWWCMLSSRAGPGESRATRALAGRAVAAVAARCDGAPVFEHEPVVHQLLRVIASERPNELSSCTGMTAAVMQAILRACIPSDIPISSGQHYSKERGQDERPRDGARKGTNGVHRRICTL